MRYIDDMIKGIPLEEMTGGTDMKNENEIRGIIPDTNSEEEESRTENNVQNTQAARTTPEAVPEEKPITPSKPVKVRSKWTSVIAAALALVVTAGGVLTYLGAAKNIGPLASVLNSDSKQAEEISSDNQKQDADKTTANKNAKLIFTTLNGYCADRISDGKKDEIPMGTFTYDLSNLSEAEPEFAYLFTSMMAGDSQISGGQISFCINSLYKPIWAQWRASDGSYVGQYPEPADGLTFGEGKTSAAENLPAGEVSATRSESEKELNSRYANSWSSSEIGIPVGTAAETAKAIAENCTEVTPDESKPEIFGPMFGLSFSYDGADFELISSDRLDAGIIINGKYCNCPEAESLLNKYGVNYEKRSYGVWISTAPNNNDGSIGFSLGEQEDAVVHWYESFLAAGYQPTEDIGSEIKADATVYTVFNFNGRMVTVANTRYTRANIQVDGKYYSVNDTSVIDAVTAAYTRSEEENKKEREQAEKDYMEAQENGLVQDYEE